MSHQKRFKLDFWIRDRVRIITDEKPEEPVFGVITGVTFSENDILYSVSSGINEKDCYSFEMEMIEKYEPPKDEK